MLNSDIDEVINAVRAKRPERIPVVMSKEETIRVIHALEGIHKLMGMLLYGSGLRLMECVRLRVKDIFYGAGSMCFPQRVYQEIRDQMKSDGTTSMRALSIRQ